MLSARARRFSFWAQFIILTGQSCTAEVGVALASRAALLLVLALGGLKSLFTPRTLPTVCFMPLEGSLSWKVHYGLSSRAPRTRLVTTRFRWMVWQAVRWKLLFLARPRRVWFVTRATPILARGVLTSMFRRRPLLRRASISCR